MKFINITNNKNLLVLIVLIPFLLIRFKYLNFVPFWDGSCYFSGLLQSIDQNSLYGFNIEHFNVHNHPSMLYLLYLSLGQYFDFGNQILLNLQITLLSVISLIFFYRILNFFFKDSILENVLCTILLSINPLFVSASINLNLDFPILLFFICFFYGLIYQNKTVLIISSFFMIFTNFSGIFFLGVTFLFFAIIYFFSKYPLKFRIRRAILVLLIPIASICLYNIRKYLMEGAFWKEGWIDSDKNALNSLIFNFNLVRARFVQIFILNYQWVPSLFILAFAIYFLFVRKVEKQKHSVLTEKNVYLFLMIFQFILLLLIYSKYQTFTNPRYILPSIFFTTFFFYYSIVRFFKNRRIITISILFFVILLFTIQNFISFDPISSWIYGTFKFGNKHLYKMTSITNEGMGIGGRDQLVYNTQYTIINKLVDKLYLKLNDEGTDFLITHNEDGNFFLFSKYDINSKKRTFRSNDFIIPNVSTISDINKLISNGQTPDASRIYYINLPWISNLKSDRNLMKFNIDTSDELFVEEDGYKLSYFRIILD